VIRFNRTVISFFLLLFSVSIAQDAKTNIAVIDLDPTGISNNEAQFLSNRLRIELFETGKFQVVEREKMNAILNEQGFQQSGCTSVECAIEIGQLLNVNVMVAGSIGKIEDIYSLSIRLIDVETGVIIRTATRDYEGNLSEVLTDVIPEVSIELADAENIETDEPEEEKKSVSDFNRFAILLKGGFSFLNYTSDINKAINGLDPLIAQKIDELSNHSIIGLEVRYALSERWNLKLGLNVENLISVQSASAGLTILFREWQYERQYQFVNTYIGVNYSLWQKPENYDIYLGVDIGSTVLNSKVIQHFVWLDGSGSDSDRSYSYSDFSWKMSFGGIYFISSRVSLGLEMALRGGSIFNLTDQIPDVVQDEDTVGIIYPEEINAAGLLIALYLGYHF